jgi:hypothetical protein
MATVCFIQESPGDFLLYYPIIKILEDRKIEYTTLKITGMTTPEVLYQLSQYPTVKTYVMYGVSPIKLSTAILCKEYGKQLVTIHGNETSGDPYHDSYGSSINLLASSHFVCADGARTFLLDRGIETPIGLFECPITHLARKAQDTGNTQVVYIGTNLSKLKAHESELKTHGHGYKTFDFSNGLPEDWKSIYGYLKSASHIVSDMFIFDKPARYLSKHFFYFGDDVLDVTNLGISTHIVSKKLELHDYLKQSWSRLEDVNKRYGITPLLNLL